MKKNFVSKFKVFFIDQLEWFCLVSPPSFTNESLKNEFQNWICDFLSNHWEVTTHQFIIAENVEVAIFCNITEQQIGKKALDCVYGRES